MSDIKWYFHKPFEIFRYPIGIDFAGIAVLAFLVGSTAIFSKEKMKFFILILPPFFALLASGLNLYPFSGRLLLFLTPFLLILVAEGVEEIRIKTRPNSAIIGIALIGLLFLNPLLTATKNLINPGVKEEIKPVLHYIRKHEEGGDILYLYWGAWAQYRYYSKRFNLRKDYIQGVSSTQNWGTYITDIDKLRGNKRVWILFSHIYNWGDIDEEKFFLYYLNSIGTELENFKSAGASVYLFNLDKQSTQLQ